MNVKNKSALQNNEIGGTQSTVLLGDMLCSPKIIIQTIMVKF